MYISLSLTIENYHFHESKYLKKKKIYNPCIILEEIFWKIYLARRYVIGWKLHYASLVWKLRRNFPRNYVFIGVIIFFYFFADVLRKSNNDDLSKLITDRLPENMVFTREDRSTPCGRIRIWKKKRTHIFERTRYSYSNPRILFSVWR